MVSLLAVGLASAALEPVPNADLTAALSYQEELAHTSGDQAAGYFVRVYSVPTVIGECGGPVSSCPDVNLLITVSLGDLGETPSLFRLPPAKGWEFDRWQPTCDPTPDEPKAGLVLHTVLPDANIDTNERAEWESTTYEVCVGLQSASFVARRGNDD